ncbi:MAG: hypothetical protein M1820_004030 [Bogoriella megaspora]|nr:MAG: hypothetical protein M1820_004030 [Bogoriella megaspora]
MFNQLLQFLRAQYALFGFHEVVTPTIYKKSLWEKSGHWENYAEDMYEVTGRGARGTRELENDQSGQNEKYGLKPMNCPGHCLLFASENRSYRDLPIRFADFSPLHRNEISGALSGLTRVRRFHQDDGHIFCRQDQIQEEISSTLQFVSLVYKTFNLGPYKLVLSTRPTDHYIGTISEWTKAEDQLKAALNAHSTDWALNPGDGAFYGPKIDIILKDSDGKDHQTATIQLDFQLPQRFSLSYDTATRTSEPPVLIHRAILGSLERFLALLIEHYNGRYPFWLSPRPCTVLTVNDSDSLVAYAQKTQRWLAGLPPVGDLRMLGPRQLHSTATPVSIDTSARPLSKKVQEAKIKGFSYIAVVGPMDVEKETVALEAHGQKWQEGVLEKALDDGKGMKGPVTLPLDAVRAYFVELMDRFL